MPPEQTSPSSPEPFNFLETDPRKNFAPWFLKFCLILILIGLGIAGYFKYQAYQIYKSIPPSQVAPIVTFDQCAAAGNPIMESFPEQCRTVDGVHFVNWRATDQMCAEVITPATNPASGETRQFPTPCDVPQDWEKL